MPWAAFWALWIVAGLGLETWALWRGEEDATLTAFLRRLVRRRWLWAAGMGLSLWAIGHVFFGLD